MADANSGGPFHERFQPAAWAALERLRDRALAGRAVNSFHADLTRIRELLRTDPVRWGDPLNDYHHLSLTHYRGLSTFLCVYFSVLVPKRTVIIQRVEVNPFGPLA